MTNAFLQRIFTRYLLPEAVYDMALDTYGPRYAVFFAAEMRLGARVSCLMGSDDDELILCIALKAGNRAALSAVLGTKKISDYLLRQVLTNWSLSKFDRRVLGNMSMSKAARGILSGTDWVSSTEDEIDTTWFRGMFISEPQNQRHYDRRALESAKGISLVEWAPHNETGIQVSMSPSQKVLEEYDWFTAKLCGVLVNEMGDGTTGQSLENWRYFLSLVDQACEQPVTDIVGVAKSMSRGGLAFA